MCGPYVEAGQQEGVFDDYRTVAGRLRRIAFFAPSACRGETIAATGTKTFFIGILPDRDIVTDRR